MPPTLIRSSSRYFPNGTGCLTPLRIVEEPYGDHNDEGAYTPRLDHLITCSPDRRERCRMVTSPWPIAPSRFKSDRRSRTSPRSATSSRTVEAALWFDGDIRLHRR